MTTARLSLRIDAELKNRLELEAKREERSASFLAIKAIEAMLRDRAEKRAASRSAIQEADKGSFISQDAMDAWVAYMRNRRRNRAAASGPEIRSIVNREACLPAVHDGRSDVDAEVLPPACSRMERNGRLGSTERPATPFEGSR